MPATFHSAGWREFRDLSSLLRTFPKHGRFQLVEEPTEADWILFVEGDASRNFLRLRKHPLVKGHFEKCFLFGHLANRLKPLPGIYTSVSTRELATGKYRPVSYPALDSRPRNPFLGAGYVDCPRRCFFSFVGAATSWTRRRLYRTRFNRTDVLIEDSSAYHAWTRGADVRWQKRYVESILGSEFVLCPRGYGLGTLRLFEVMQMGRVPVVLADEYQFPAGPDWAACSVRVAERDIARLPEILEPLRPHAIEMGRQARRAWERYFHPERQMTKLLIELEQVATTLKRSRWQEFSRWRLQIPCVQTNLMLRRLARHGLLAGNRLLGLPYACRFQ